MALSGAGERRGAGGGGRQGGRGKRGRAVGREGGRGKRASRPMGALLWQEGLGKSRSLSCAHWKVWEDGGRGAAVGDGSGEVGGGQGEEFPGNGKYLLKCWDCWRRYVGSIHKGMNFEASEPRAELDHSPSRDRRFLIPPPSGQVLLALLPSHLFLFD